MPLYGSGTYGSALYGAPGSGNVNYEISVGFSAALAGVFIVGSSIVGGADVLAGVYSSPAWVDITADVRQVDTRRGRSDDLLTMQAGSCTLTLQDTTGKYAPDNAAGPFYGQLVPLRPVRVRATYMGVITSLFTGWTTDISSNPDRGVQRATILAKDLFVWMDQDGALPTIPATGPTTTGAAIGLILDAIGWTNPTMRRLAVGDSIPTFTADGKTSALTLIGGLLDAECGVFYIAADGTAVYEDKAARNRAPRLTSQSTIASMAALYPGVSLTTIKNRSTVTRQPLGGVAGVPQTYADPASVAAYHPRDFPPLTTPYLDSDAKALNLARYKVALRAKVQTNARDLNLDGLEPTALAALLARDLSDRVTVTEAMTSTNADFHIEQIEQRIVAPARHTGAYKLSKRPTGLPFIVGQSLVDGPDILVPF